MPYALYGLLVNEFDFECMFDCINFLTQATKQIKKWESCKASADVVALLTLWSTTHFRSKVLSTPEVKTRKWKWRTNQATGKAHLKTSGREENSNEGKGGFPTRNDCVTPRRAILNVYSNKWGKQSICIKCFPPSCTFYTPDPLLFTPYLITPACHQQCTKPLGSLQNKFN